MTKEPDRDHVRLLLEVAILGSLVAVSVWIMAPFLPALIWATMIVVATWPLMKAAEARLWKRRGLAATVMTLAMLLAFFGPLSAAIMTLVSHADVITGWVKSVDPHTFDVPPDWVAKIPVAGTRLDTAWRDLAQDGELGEKIAAVGAVVGKWFFAQIGDLGAVVLQFLLTVVIAAILYVNGETASAGVIRFARRIGGDRGEGSVVLAAQAIRGVALGVVVTAVIQSALGGVGLAIAGVPYVTLLTAAMFMLALAQIGPLPIMAGATIWVFTRGETGWGVFMIVWTIVVGALDNVLRPILIKRGVDLPILLILVGVIGGLIAFGMVGIFVGPSVLAVCYRLVASWVGPAAAPEAPPEDPSRAS
jgi:predicted PurR-regulated permease PerM